MEKFGKEYRKEYYGKNKDKWEDKERCIYCNVEYKKTNKHNNNRTRNHELNYKNYIIKEQFELINKNIEILRNNIN